MLDHGTRKWLKANLGPKSLAPLTGTDVDALNAAVAVSVLYRRVGNVGSMLTAYRECVIQMQPETRQVAYHAIAMVLDWEDRYRIWTRCGLWGDSRFTSDNRWLCASEPTALAL